MNDEGSPQNLSSHRAEFVKKALSAYTDPKRRQSLPEYFQAVPGGYGEGDRFIGVAVPNQRKVAQTFRDLPLSEVAGLLESPVHEHRLTALFILIEQFDDGDAEKKESCIELYLEHLDAVNNWDLVDSSAPPLLGAWLLTRDRAPLFELAGSGRLWRERAALMATLAFVREKDFEDALAIAAYSLGHPHPLMQKAIAWVLREIGARDPDRLAAFVEEHRADIGRGTLRAAVGKLPEAMQNRLLETN